ncbi:MAG: hypothetical protein U9O24_05140 [Campylobacterota bacterium]|nr:hypothetical protein [Campylobacterota bacterium]
MKKLFTVLVLSAFLVSSAWGAVVEGSITKLVVLEGGDVEVTLGALAGKRIRDANSNKKEMYAMLLTAHAAGLYVKLTHTNGYIKTTAIIPAP